MSNRKLPICPRCESDTTKVLTRSPVKDVWEVYSCGTCLFAWRSKEPDYITNPESYDKRFKLNPQEIDKIPDVPAIPPLTKQQ